MKQAELKKFMQSLSDPRSALITSIRNGSNLPLSDKALTDARRFISEMGEEIETFQATYNEAREQKRRWIETQAPRNWKQLMSGWEKDEGARFHKRIEALKSDHNLLKNAVEKAEISKKEAAAAKNQAQFETFCQARDDILAEVGAMSSSEAAKKVIDLADMVGSCLQEYFEPILSLKKRVGSLKNKAILLRNAGFDIEPMPEDLDLSFVDQLQTAIEHLVGHEIVTPTKFDKTALKARKLREKEINEEAMRRYKARGWDKIVTEAAGGSSSV